MLILKKYISVSDADSFFTDPDPGFFFPIRIQEKRTHFFNGKNKILGEIFVFNPKSTVGILFLFSTNRVGILFKGTGTRRKTFKNF